MARPGCPGLFFSAIWGWGAIALTFDTSDGKFGTERL